MDLRYFWRSKLYTHWKDWCWSWSWSYYPLATWCEQLTHWKRSWCWEISKAEEEGNRGWNGWMASPIQWTWTWGNSRRWWGTGNTDVLQSMGRKKLDMTWVTKNTAQKNKHVIYWYGCNYQKNSQKELKLVAFGEKIKGAEAAPCSNNQSYGTIWLFKLCISITLAKTKLKRLMNIYFPLIIFPSNHIAPVVQSPSCVRLFSTSWTVAHQAPLPMGFSRQEYWSGLPCPPPGDLPNPGMEPNSPSLQVDSLPSEPPGKPKNTGVGSLFLLQGIIPTQFVFLIPDYPSHYGRWELSYFFARCLHPYHTQHFSSCPIL